MRRAQVTSTDFYYLLVSSAFILIGGAALALMASEYSLDESGEGIGFRQAAVLETYARADEFLLYSEVAARFSFQEGLLSYHEESMGSLFEEPGCGRIGSYPAWNSESQSCFRSDLSTDETLLDALQDSFSSWWSHPASDEPLRYDFSFEEEAGTLRVFGGAQEDLFLPVVGVRDDYASLAYEVASSAGTSLGLSFESESVLEPEVVSDPDRVARTQAIDRIVIHYTAGSSREGAVAALQDRGGVSAHYVLGRDGTLTQMVPEGAVAYHAGGCGADGCAIEGMNARSVGIEVVNLGWQRPGDLQVARPLREGECREGYAYATLACDYESFRESDVRACEEQREEYLCWQEYPQGQLEALATLIADIAHRHDTPIDREHIISHEEIKVAKQDPGPAFPWDEVLRLAREATPQEPDAKDDAVGESGVSSNGCFSQEYALSFGEETNDAVRVTRANLEGDGVLGLVAQVESEYELPQGLLFGTLTQESRGDSSAVSTTGCAGVAQFCVGTARDERFSEHFDADTVESCSCNDDGSCTIEESSCSPSDHRFDPERAIPAAGEYLGILLGQFDEYEPARQVFLAAQAYNTGPGAVSAVAEDCAGEDGIESFRTCVEEELRPSRGDEAEHASKVLTYMSSVGGVVDGVSNDRTCDDVRVKGLGRLLIDPSFESSIPDAITPLEELVGWARELVEETDDDLHLTSDELSSAPQEWVLEAGFCPEDSNRSVLDRVVESLQECERSGQSGCSCQLSLEEGYEVVFTSGGSATLYPAGEDSRVLARTGAPLLTLVDGAQVQAVRLESEASGLSYSVLDEESSSDEALVWEPLSEASVFVRDETLMINTTPSGSCLLTDRLQSFCAVNEGVALLNDSGASYPLARFGLVFNDSVMPSQAGGSSLAPTGPLESPSGLRFSFNKPSEDDLSGVLVYCRWPGQEYSLYERIPEDDLDSVHSLELSECAGEPVMGDGEYSVAVHSFDFGGNENDAHEDCANVASFEFDEDDDWSAVGEALGFGSWVEAYELAEDLWAGASGCSLLSTTSQP